MYSSDYVWAKILAYLEKRLTATIISAWFDDAEVVELTDTRLVLYSPSPYRKDIIEHRCAEYIRAAMKELFETDIELVVFGDEELASYRDKSKRPAFIEFNPQFTFDKFVVGSSNSFAYAAAFAVANHPAEVYNPLFIYGPSGLGKTHLLYAIAAEIHHANPQYNIVYIKGDQFTNELITALKDGKNIEFREKYRNADLFLMDDIQFIGGKASTEEEFFHTFNTLYENHKQIILTSDRSPSELVRLEDRLRTRFEWGLICDVQPPDYETRMAIIKSKAISLGLDFSDEVCNYIAENITNNVRQLEGSVKKIKALHDLTGMPIDVQNVARAIKDMYRGNEQALPTPNLIIGEVCRFYSIAESTLRSTQKSRGTAEAWQVAMYLIRKLTNLSFPDIGKEFGKDHTTVIYAIKKVEQALSNANTGMQDNIRDIIANINSKL